jgi:acetylornithine deacetylase/succinyl-diaminopimelate desuccinylase family protein
MVNKKRLFKLMQDLIRLDSQNPPGNESAIAGFVRDHLKGLGVRTKAHLFAKNRVNIIGSLPCKKGSRSLLITPHLDTVPAGKSWGFEPLRATVAGGRMYGLGTTDCKVNLACALEAINVIVDGNIRLDYELIFAATADEESGSELGLIPLLNKGILKPDAAVVLDADDFEIVITQKGLMHLKVKVKGKKAHGAYPWLGVNAIDKSMDILKDLKKLEFSRRKNKYLHPPTINIGTIKGGDKVNVVADWCEFELDFRFLPGERGEDILERVKKVIRKHSRCFEIEVEGIQKPYFISQDHELVRSLAGSMRKMKIKPLIRGSEGATVITFFQDKGIPAIATGFGSEGQAHMADEYVKVENIYRGADVLVDFLKSYSSN